MSNVDWAEVASCAVERDPRKYPIGYLSGSSLVLASAQAFVWFESIEELTQFLFDVEPRVYDLAPGNGLEAFQDRLRPILEAVRKQGLTEELRVAVDRACSRDFCVDWWGAFEDLCAGKGELERDVLDAYLGEGRAGQVLRPDELGDFVEFVQTYGA
jgi:hypothetical protein